MNLKIKYFATVPLNIEGLLADELKEFGADEIHQVRSGVSFTGTIETAYKACLWSRTAIIG